MYEWLNREFTKWALVASTTFILDSMLFYFLYKILRDVFFANLVAFGISTSYNFILHKTWTYQKSQASYLRLPRYLALLLTTLVTNSALIHVFLHLEASALFSKIVASIVTIPLSFFGLRSFVFGKSNQN